MSEEYEQIKDNRGAVTTSCGADSIPFPLSGPTDPWEIIASHITVSLRWSVESAVP
jgi:hypothetical protein